MIFRECIEQKRYTDTRKDRQAIGPTDGRTDGWLFSQSVAMQISNVKVIGIKTTLQVKNQILRTRASIVTIKP